MVTTSPSQPPELAAADGSESSAHFEPPRQANTLSLSKGRHSRSNTVEEKRRMRKDMIRRKKRGSRLVKLKDKVGQLQCELRFESSQKAKAELNVIAFKNRARTFWERWRWELEKRREAIRDLQFTQLKAKRPHKCETCSYMEIVPSMLNDPMLNGKQEEKYVGRGSFGVVKVVFRDMLVAVKEYLPKSLKNDVFHEASILNKLCHPYLPLLIGICTSQEPLRIVMQFHAFNELQSKTMHMELLNNSAVNYGLVYVPSC